MKAATRSRQTCNRMKGNLCRSEETRGEEIASGLRMERRRRERDLTRRELRSSTRCEAAETSSRLKNFRQSAPRIFRSR
ncbi:hypothetical protein AVEN_164949-1 [Araneus ventricosus]|uniref:Uncharacterized protein n=1 Tax=Araneus ventricosus TaxID=182803 RepID=A0A4Y2VX26_ARAVE|nr:hypothetical protein AVEN_164949-1 [Araneus ventricosus]